MIPTSLRTWFVIHFIVDIIFAIPPASGPGRFPDISGLEQGRSLCHTPGWSSAHGHRRRVLSGTERRGGSVPGHAQFENHLVGNGRSGHNHDHTHLATAVGRLAAAGCFYPL